MAASTTRSDWRYVGLFDGKPDERVTWLQRPPDPVGFGLEEKAILDLPKLKVIQQEGLTMIYIHRSLIEEVS